MKKDKLRALDPAEMQDKLREIDEQSFRIKFQMSMGQTEGLRKMRENAQGPGAPADLSCAKVNCGERSNG